MGYLNPPNENEKNAEAIEYYLNYIRSIAADAARSMHSCFSPLLMSCCYPGWNVVAAVPKKKGRKGSFLDFTYFFV